VFTGIVEAVGRVEAVREGRGARRIAIRAPGAWGDLTPGASVAVDGACLTAVEVRDGGFAVDAIGTTLSRTVAGRYAVGSRVNLERALRMGDRLDGHLVQGHVDAVGELLSVREEGDYRLLDLTLTPDVEEVTVLHGSIAVNGVSLTVNALGPGRCQVAIIPYTWDNTNLADLEPGDPVNLEADLIGKHVGRFLAVRAGAGKARPDDPSATGPVP